MTFLTVSVIAKPKSKTDLCPHLFQTESLWNLNWPQIFDPLASASQVLKLQVHAHYCRPTSTITVFKSQVRSFVELKS